MKTPSALTTDDYFRGVFTFGGSSLSRDRYFLGVIARYLLVMSSRFLSRDSNLIINLIVVENFTLISPHTLRKRKEAAVTLLTRVHCYATHYLSQNT